MKIRHLCILLTALLASTLLLSCSTTRRIPKGELLYTGLKKFDVDAPEGVKLPSALVSSVKEAGNVKPNNPMPLLSPYVRTPFPVGLWVYNNWSDSARGIKGWLYSHLVSQPVLVSKVKPAARVKMMKTCSTMPASSTPRPLISWSPTSATPRRPASIIS